MVSTGKCFGFLGPNGAGKTSVMRMISCVSPISGGELTIDGKDVESNKKAIKMNLGVVSQADSLDPNLNVSQNLMAFARYFDIPSDTAKERIEESLELFNLSGKASQMPNELSGGMRRRLLIARALLHHPSILVLDEPTTGLDPQSRHMVWDKLVQLKERGMTLILTTHYMDEAEYLCDRLVILDEGRILVEGISRELVKKYAGEKVIEIRSKYLNKQELIRILGKESIEFEDLGESIFIFATGKSSLNLDLLQGYDVITRSANLEDVFLRLTGRGLREE